MEDEHRCFEMPPNIRGKLVKDKLSKRFKEDVSTEQIGENEATKKHLNDLKENA